MNNIYASLATIGPHELEILTIDKEAMNNFRGEIPEGADIQVIDSETQVLLT